jgi:hypothetical protein
MFASRWPASLPFMVAYPLRSEVVRARADRPEGPYHFEQVALPAHDPACWDGRMTHNPTIHRWRGTYYLFYIGSTYDGPTPDDDDPMNTLQDRQRSGRSWGNIRIGLATADDVRGPWRRRPTPILDVRPNCWDHQLVTNPAVCIREDGRTLLVYRSPGPGHALLGLAFADHPEGPYRRLCDEPIFPDPGDARKHVEDPYLWWQDGCYQLIAKDLTGQLTGERHAGVHATSDDGIRWRISDPPLAYSRTIVWSDGTVATLGCLERPQLLLQEGVPTHLCAAAADGPGGFDHASRTWNLVVPLRH